MLVCTITGWSWTRGANPNLGVGGGWSRSFDRWALRWRRYTRYQRCRPHTGILNVHTASLMIISDKTITNNWQYRHATRKRCRLYKASKVTVLSACNLLRLMMTMTAYRKIIIGINLIFILKHILFIIDPTMIIFIIICNFIIYHRFPLYPEDGEVFSGEPDGSGATPTAPRTPDYNRLLGLNTLVVE